MMVPCRQTDILVIFGTKLIMVFGATEDRYSHQLPPEIDTQEEKVMLNPAAEQSFRSGMDALVSRKTREAFAFFSGAIEIERQQCGPRPIQARYVSYYGLTLASTRGDLHEAVRCCRTAVKMESYRPDLCWNLGQVLIAADRRREAHRVLARAAQLQPGHSGIQRDLGRLGRRRRPPVPFLSRSNKINILLGKLFRSPNASR